MHVTILIPTFNEKENLKILIPLLYKKIYPMRPKISFSTLVVDDHSPDGTSEVVEEFSQTYPQFFVSYGDKEGIGNAMKRGYRYALEQCKPDAVITYEADFVFSPETIIRLIDGLSGSDVVLASRENVSEFYSSSWSRYVGHFVANTVIPEWVGGLNQVHEHTAAGRAIKVKDALEKVDFDSLPNGYSFFPAILYVLAKQKMKIQEIPVTFTHRQVGESKMKVTATLHELLDSLRAALVFRFSK